MDTLPEPVENVVEQEVEDGLLLLRATGDYMIVNGTGRMIWRHLRESRNLTTLMDSLLTSKGAPGREKCKEYVLAFVHDLQQAGFLRESS